MAGTLTARDAMPIGPDSPVGKIAVALAVAVPIDEQTELDRLLAGRERGDDAVLDITSRWSVLGMPDGLVLARLDLMLEGQTVATPVSVKILFDVRETGPVLWAACLTRRMLLLREPTFRPAMEAPKPWTVGMEVGNLGGCDVLRVALERAGVPDSMFRGRHS